MANELTKEVLEKMMRETKDKQQNEFIDKLYEMVDNLCEKANKKVYQPTDHERKVFRKIYNIITAMNNWF